MYYKCELLVGGYSYGVTDRIRNWDEITVSFKRSDYDGIVRTFTDKFEFVKDARLLLLDEYKTNYLKANASIVISTRNNSWTWTERFRCPLNFSTLSDDGYVLSINAVDNSVAALIKAKKGTEYEYPVNELKDEFPLYYDRMMIDCYSDWIEGSSIDETTGNKTISFPSGAYESYAGFPVYVTKSEIGIKNIVEIQDVNDDFGENYQVTPFFVAKKSMDVDLNISGVLTWLGDGTDSETRNPSIRMFKKNGRSIEYINYGWSLKRLQMTTISYSATIPLKEGDGLCLAVFNEVQGPFTIQVNFGLNVSVSFKGKGDSALFDCIHPSVLLNRLLKSMNSGKEGLIGVIIPSGERRLDNALILASESVRKLQNAKIYSSFSKFCQWMSAMFGYVYDINGKTVTFRPRTDYFGSEPVKNIDDSNNYTLSVNSSLIYSQLNVGYEKQDYESVNGRDEFRFTNIYNTGITISENRMELISPYRADAYGIEFLAQRIGESTTDSSSDNDVFFVCARLEGERYILDRTDAIEGVADPSTMFNVMYSPTSMIEANGLFLGGFISELDYASSEGNAAVVINGYAEDRDMSLEGGIFSVSEVEFETSDIDLPEDMTGLVQLEHQGEVIHGYYKSADFHYTKTRSAKITLIVKK